MKQFLLTGALIAAAFISTAQNPGIKTGWYYAGVKTDSSLFVTGPRDSAFIYPTPVITVKDFKKLKVVNENYGSVLEVTLTDPGKEKIAAATRNWKGNKLAFILDGALEMVPVIQSEITEGKVMISGLFTQQELKALKKKLEKEMGAK